MARRVRTGRSTRHVAAAQQHTTTFPGTRGRTANQRSHRSASESRGLVLLTQIREYSGEVVGCSQGVGVVVAEDPAAAGEGVLGELAGLLVSP